MSDIARITKDEPIADIVERLPRVEGILNYLAPMGEKPMNLAYDPPPGAPRSNSIAESHVMPIYDVRPVAWTAVADVEGSAVVEHRSAVQNFMTGPSCAGSITQRQSAWSQRLPAQSRVGKPPACTRPRAIQGSNPGLQAGCEYG